MAKINWTLNNDHTFETGLDRGVLYPSGGGAVPWNGLTSVDEKGGDSATTYYMDGRPFLNLPKPKEYSATLQAYTYPDEFAACMGLEEVADGMYLDSQMGDYFGLSYRTLIGSANEGTSADYKIHVVYNASVVAPDSSYATLSDSVDPFQFSWDIQAVPVPVAGYRSTAHIIIDTRHMDTSKLVEVENLLYGTLTTPATLPAPSALLDLLSFGDAIIITDNGDGTWTAEGSTENVYMLSDGVFEITGVTATTPVNGIFSITSTP